MPWHLGDGDTGEERFHALVHDQRRVDTGANHPRSVDSLA